MKNSLSDKLEWLMTSWALTSERLMKAGSSWQNILGVLMAIFGYLVALVVIVVFVLTDWLKTKLRGGDAKSA